MGQWLARWKSATAVDSVMTERSASTATEERDARQTLPEGGCRKRQRARPTPRTIDVIVHTADTLSQSTLPADTRQQWWGHMLIGLHLRRGIVKAMATGPSIMRTYGAHYHLYPSDTADSAHGIAIGWDLTQRDLSVCALLRLCRVANTCRKSVVVLVESNHAASQQPFDSKEACVMELTYCPSI